MLCGASSRNLYQKLVTETVTRNLHEKFDASSSQFLAPEKWRITNINDLFSMKSINLLISSLFHSIITKFYKKQPITNDNKNNNNRPANHVARFVSRARQFLWWNRAVFYSVPETGTRKSSRLTVTHASFWYQTTGTSFCDACRRLYLLQACWDELVIMYPAQRCPHTLPARVVWSLSTVTSRQPQCSNSLPRHPVPQPNGLVTATWRNQLTLIWKQHHYNQSWYIRVYESTKLKL